MAELRPMRTLSCTIGLSLVLSLLAGCQRSEKIESANKAQPSANAANEIKPGTAAGEVATIKAPESPTPTAPAVPTTMSNNTNEVAVIKTSAGEMVLEFWPDVAPKTVANFITLAKKGFYDGTCFHRIIKGFMVQGGDPLTKDASKEAQWGTGDPGYKIDAEFNERSHQRGVISMARSNDPNSAGCQFFLCHGDASFLDRKYTAFGKLIKGDDVLEKIANTPVAASRGGEASKPTTRVEVQSIKIVPANTLK
jgi:peptidyl-prolyl cis-trans isomerase B (cyclophilin B)